jgi:L-fuculose-phosphate aldolase
MFSETDADLVHPRDALLRTMERIYRYRMTTTSGGNLSIRDDDDAIWITPARLDKGALRRDDIVRVAPDGAAEGTHRPSSEFPFHRAVYQVRPDLRAIVHAHPVALVAFSICRQVPETRLLPVARRVCGRVGFAPYALPGSEALGRSIAGAFADGFDCVVLENHGVVIGGTDLRQAFERFETLEFCAKTIIKAGFLGEVRYPADADYQRPGPPDPLPSRARAEPPSSVEKELRRQIRDFVRRSYQQRLMISTQGAFSARLGQDAFLITPHRVDRSTLEIEDLVRVAEGAVEPGKTPSTAVFPHRAIYQSHPGVQAIVHAYPVNATAFGVTSAAFDSRTIPESYLFLRDVSRAPFADRFGDGRALAGRTSPGQPVVLIENDGVQVCGTSVLDAFDRLEVLETTAEAMINSRPLGAMTPMGADAIEELNRAFGLS